MHRTSLYTLSLAVSLLAAGAARGAEPVIVETETGITVEYTGTPSPAPAAGQPAADKKQAPGATAPDPTPPGKLARKRFVASQYQHLQREAADLLKVTGQETDEELAGKGALAAEKQAQAETYAEEYRKLTGEAPPETVQDGNAATADSSQSQYLNQRNDREERIRRTKELRKSTRSFASAE